jgi:hypothetical protein
MAEICKELHHKGETNDSTDITARIEALAALYPLTLEALQTA